MAELFIPPGYANVACRFRLPLSPLFRSVTFGVDTTGGPVSTQDCVNLVETVLNDPLTPQNLFSASSFSSAATFSEVYMLRNVAGDLQSAIAPANSIGTRPSSSNLMPPNVSVCIRKRTALVGKKFRGRIYLPSIFLNDTDVDNYGNMEGARVSDLNGLAGQTLTKLAAADLPMVLLHAESPLLPNVITALQCAPTVSTQKRRLY